MVFLYVFFVICVNFKPDDVKCSRNVANDMNISIGDLIFNLEQEQKKSVRAVERAQKRFINCEYAVIFNTKCIQDGLLPNYTHLKLHDQAVRKEGFTYEFRRILVEEQLRRKQLTLRKLSDELNKLNEECVRLIPDPDVRSPIENALLDEKNYYNQVVKNRVTKKLNRLYGGHVLLPETCDSYLNLSQKVLTADQKEFLNLGINCHIGSKFRSSEKTTELEILFESILKLQGENKVDVSPNLRHQLLAESTKHRRGKPHQLISDRLKKAAEELRNDPDIVIRKGDKSSLYVILNREDYHRKLDNILQDRSKFMPITSDPTAQLKKRLNALITAANALKDGVHFQKIIGEYKPGYIYGKVKTHKDGNPLRPIISQIPTPSYHLAKRLNELITPYIPTHHTLKSSDELIDILHSSKPAGLIASLDVESLFTNVPVERTIEVICDYVYNNQNSKPLTLSRPILTKMLKACTTESPFRCPQGQLYRQIDGIAMGSPLGVLFANAYMCKIESEVLDEVSEKPKIYKRYVDDIFVECDTEDQLTEIHNTMENKSVLKFTHEIGTEKKLPFLDISVDASSPSRHHMEVHRKSTNTGKCLNASSECPQRYIRGVIRTYVRRALKTCTTWAKIDSELKNIKRILTNNNYSTKDIDQETNKAIDLLINKKITNKSTEQKPATPDRTGTTHRLYYKNQFSSAYKEDERVLKNIIKKNVAPKNHTDRIVLIIYYKSRTTSNLIMKNNTHQESKLKANNVVYMYRCPHGDCKLRNTTYVGHTKTSLSRRLTCHLQTGAPRQHTLEEHGYNITRSDLVNNTKILATEKCQKRLQILEAVIIRENSPTLNIQYDFQGILKLYDGTNGRA